MVAVAVAGTEFKVEGRSNRRCVPFFVVVEDEDVEEREVLSYVTDESFLCDAVSIAGSVRAWDEISWRYF